ncbi:MAG: hypothetical protein NTY53_14480 [Kiritimatiellaeota bacterium]|nr:hypothetical protein [Kiritimatiellota bacterium]
MWIRRTIPEIEQARNRRWREDICHSAVFGLFIAVLATFMRGWREADRKGTYLVPFEEIERRLPWALLYGIVAAFGYYWIESKKKTYVCVKCGTVKSKCNTSNCSCGGTVENILKLRWVDDPLAASAKEPSYETIKCFNCGAVMPPAIERCSICGWTYKKKTDQVNE